MTTRCLTVTVKLAVAVLVACPFLLSPGRTGPPLGPCFRTFIPLLLLDQCVSRLGGLSDIFGGWASTVLPGEGHAGVSSLPEAI